MALKDETWTTEHYLRGFHISSLRLIKKTSTALYWKQETNESKLWTKERNSKRDTIMTKQKYDFD